MSQRSATVLGVYNRTLYIERSVVSTAKRGMLKSANGKAYGKVLAEQRAKSWLSKGQSPGWDYQIWTRKSPQNTSHANIKKGGKKTENSVHIATRVRRQAYGRYTGAIRAIFYGWRVALSYGFSRFSSLDFLVQTSWVNKLQQFDKFAFIFKSL